MMLRITEVEGRGGRELHLEGWVAEQTVGELEAACAAALDGASALALDLSDVRFVDEAGATLLRALRAGGCALGGASPFVLGMIDPGTDGAAVSRAALPDPAEEAEGVLLRELRAGSPEAFERLVRQRSGALLAVARRFLPVEDDARDAVQEAFLSAFKALPTFAGGAKLSTWLHRIVVNAALMKLRSRRRRPEESIDDLLPSFDDTGHFVTPASSWTAPTEAAVESREMRAAVRRCIDRLPETFRTVLLLRDIEELDTEETAAILGVTPNAVKIRLHRARQALRTLLERELAPAHGSARAGAAAQPIG